MKVIVPTLGPDSPASCTLAIERIAYREELIEGDYGYGQLFARLWEKAEPFTIVEHDICPWPGALDVVTLCPHPWCGFPYPVDGTVPAGYNVEGYCCSLGLMKFGPEIVSGPPPPDLATTHWATLDRVILDALSDYGHRCHVHLPGVAHQRTIRHQAAWLPRPPGVDNEGNPLTLKRAFGMP